MEIQFQLLIQLIPRKFLNKNFLIKIF